MDTLLKNKLKYFVGGEAMVLVCIGTDLLSGDCLGPLVGQMLVDSGAPFFVYGTLKCPVTALNIDRVNEFIKKRHKGSVVVAIDSAVGEEVGAIRVNKGALKPGSALGKKLNEIGDVSITVTTTKSLPGEEGFGLVPLGFVYAAAKRVVEIVGCRMQKVQGTLAMHNAQGIMHN